MRIVFMGTPEYSVKTLSALYDAGYEIVGVFAQPDKPVGRKQLLTPPAVKVYAKSKEIPVFQPKTLRDGTAYDILKNLSPDVIVVVAYGKILPEEILELPPMGCINGHASLLPKLRGASPIQWSIISGECVTGITTMLMDRGMDTGDILETSEIEIGKNETADRLFERLADVSADLMLSTLKKLQEGTLTPRKQDDSLATYAPIIKKEMAHLDFTKNAQMLFNEIRGFYSWPCSYFFLDGKRIKVIKSAVGAPTDRAPGTVIANIDNLVIACGDNTSLVLKEVQPEGSRAMTSEQMLRGHKIPLGAIAE